jgi:MprA protease rhombosortase-interaction domain-containing protein
MRRERVAANVQGAGAIAPRSARVRRKTLKRAVFLAWVATTLTIGFFFAFLMSTAVSAYPLMLDYTGFTWTSLVGGQSRMQSVGVLDGFTPNVATSGEIYTYHLSGLVLASEQDLGAGYRLRTYSGGSFRIYQSTSPGNRPYVYGTNPPAAAAPPSFVDRILWLGGAFSDFTLLEDSQGGLSSFSGSGAYAEGSFLPNLEDADLYTFAGLTNDPAAAVPSGYAYRADGQLTAHVRPVPEPTGVLLLAAGLLGFAATIRRPR